MFQEDNVTESLFNKIAVLQPTTLLKKGSMSILKVFYGLVELPV